MKSACTVDIFAAIPHRSCVVAGELLISKSLWVGLARSAVEEGGKRSYDVRLYSTCTSTHLNVYCPVAFKVYDMDRDGFISNGELFLVLKMMVGNNLKDGQLQQIVDKTIMEADKDGDGKLSFEEFVQMVSNTVRLVTFIRHHTLKRCVVSPDRILSSK